MSQPDSFAADPSSLIMNSTTLTTFSFMESISSLPLSTLEISQQLSPIKLENLRRRFFEFQTSLKRSRKRSSRRSSCFAIDPLHNNKPSLSVTNPTVSIAFSFMETNPNLPLSALSRKFLSNCVPPNKNLSKGSLIY
jgi:hypothetical protein